MIHPVEFGRAKRTRYQHSLVHLGECFLPSVHRSRPFVVGLRLNPKKFAQRAGALPYEMLVSDVLYGAGECDRVGMATSSISALAQRWVGGQSLFRRVIAGSSFQYPFFIEENYRPFDD
jgi:hypothetical protein